MKAGKPVPGGRVLPIYLRALWGVSPRLAVLQGDVDCILSLDGSRPVLHLPAGGDALLARARAAHAAAHLAHGGTRFPRAKLKPIQRALLETLEDARVEWIAMQALPGLRSLWAPFHVADAGRGNGFDALLARLAHALFDPGHRDPHAWIARVRSMFFAPDGRLALDAPGRLRDTASVLGHDIGQMRLPFNPAGWRVEPAYRDDNQHLWAPDDTLPPSATELEQERPDTHGAQQDADTDTPVDRPPPQAVGGSDAGEGAATALWAEAPLRTLHYPEWDRLIGRLRPRWCTLIETRPVDADAAALRAALAARQPRTASRGAASAAGRPTQRRSRDGERLHTDALIEAGIALRARHAPEPRLYRDRAPRDEPPAVLLLIDSSASTAVVDRDGRTLLERLREAALRCAQSLDGAGHSSAVQGFASDTRHRVRVQRVKDFDEPALDERVLARAAGLRSAGSTRMGAALRHAASQLHGARGIVVLLTDGEPHDIDIHDPRYLVEDLQHAVRDARRHGVDTLCLQLGGDGSSPLRHAFPRGHCIALPDARALAGALRDRGLGG